MTETELKLVELDPKKQYVVMFKGRPPIPFNWKDKPSNVSDYLLSADSIEIKDLTKVAAALGYDLIKRDVPDEA